MKRKGMTFAEHRQLGGELQKMNTRLTNLSTDLKVAYGTSTTVARRADAVARALGELRVILESSSVLGKDCPDKSREELAGVYYGRRVEGSTLGAESDLYKGLIPYSFSVLILSLAQAFALHRPEQSCVRAKRPFIVLLTKRKRLCLTQKEQGSNKLHYSPRLLSFTFLRKNSKKISAICRREQCQKHLCAALLSDWLY